MKQLLMTATALLLSGSMVIAQTATGTGTATSNSSSSSNAGAVAVSQGGGGGSAQSGATGGNAQQLQGQSIYLDQRAPGTQRITTSGETTTNYRQSGTVRNEFAPAVQAPAMGSGHPCGLARSVGISIIGGGGAGGVTTVDDACLLAQMGKTTAAMAMIAARSPSACAALVASGDISPESACGDGGRRAGGVYSRRGATGPERRGANGQPIAVGQNAGNVAPALAAASSRSPTCHVKPGTTRTIVTSATTQQERMACAARLGLR